MQVWVLEGQTFALIFSPHHEGIHRPPDPWIPHWFPLAGAQGQSSRAGWVRASRPGLCSGSGPCPCSRAGHRRQLCGPAAVKTMSPVRARSARRGTPCPTLRNLAGLRTGLLTATRLRYIHSSKTTTVKARCCLWIETTLGRLFATLSYFKYRLTSNPNETNRKKKAKKS